MLVELEELKNSPDKRLDFEFNEYIAELGNTEDVTGNISVELTVYGVKVKGNLSTNISFTCDRCLQTFTKNVNIKLDEDYLFGTLVPDGTKEYELQNNEFVNDLNGQTALDVTDIVYQIITLELPNQNLCSENCQGSDEYKAIKEDEFIDPRLEQFKTLSESNN